MKKLMLAIAVGLFLTTSCKESKLKRDIYGTWVSARSNEIVEYNETWSKGADTKTFTNSDVDVFTRKITFNKDNTYSAVMNIDINGCTVDPDAMYDPGKNFSGNWEYLDKDRIALKDVSYYACEFRYTQKNIDVEWTIVSVEKDNLTVSYEYSFDDNGVKSTLKETVLFQRLD